LLGRSSCPPLPGPFSSRITCVPIAGRRSSSSSSPDRPAGRGGLDPGARVEPVRGEALEPSVEALLRRAPARAGAPVPAPMLDAKLRRLGYRAVESEPQAPGEFFPSPEEGRLAVYLHNFDYPLRGFTGFPVEIRWSGDAITAIRRPRPAPRAGRGRAGGDRNGLRPSDGGSDGRSAVGDLVDARGRGDRRRGPGLLPARRINPRGVVRAFVQNLRGHRQGGSTLTMQLVKNLYLSPERTFRRKATEAILAMIVDSKYSKNEILEAYMNEIYLGQRGAVSITGVQEACRYYFGTDAARITLPEAALLAGMIRAPGLQPLEETGRGEEATGDGARPARRAGKIRAEQAREAGEAPLTSIDSPPNPSRRRFSPTGVISQVVDRYGPRPSREGGAADLHHPRRRRPDPGRGSGRRGARSPRRALQEAAAPEGETPLEGALVAMAPRTGTSARWSAEGSGGGAPSIVRCRGRGSRDRSSSRSSTSPPSRRRPTRS